MTATLDVIGTCNVKDTLDDAAAEAAVRAWLREGVELGGLQEWARDRDNLLRQTPPPDLDGVLVRVSKGGHITHGRGDKGGGPLVWNKTRYGLARKIRSKALVGGGFVGRLPGRRSTLGTSWATVGVFHDEILGGRVTLINAHLTAEVQVGAGYRKDKAHRARVRRHKSEVRALRRLVRSHRVRLNRVHVVLDSNYDGLELRPLVSCWAGRDGDTLGHRAVDIVFAPDKAASVKTIANKSDHRAVVATYRRT